MMVIKNSKLLLQQRQVKATELLQAFEYSLLPMAFSSTRYLIKEVCRLQARNYDVRDQVIGKNMKNIMNSIYSRPHL